MQYSAWHIADELNVGEGDPDAVVEVGLGRLGGRPDIMSASKGGRG